MISNLKHESETKAKKNRQQGLYLNIPIDHQIQFLNLCSLTLLSIMTFSANFEQTFVIKGASFMGRLIDIFDIVHSGG